MKKLLGLLAVAPMALAACGGSEAEAVAKADVNADAYYLGHGYNTGTDGVAGAQNDTYNLIGINLEVEADEITYTINESVGYVSFDAEDLDADSKAVAEWTLQTDAADAADQKGTLGKDIKANSTNNAAVVAGVAIADMADDKYYLNEGESLRYTFGVEEVEFDSAKDKMTDGSFYTAKTNSNYGSGRFEFRSNAFQWENHLEATWGTCTVLNADTTLDATIADFAANKTAGASTVAGATAGETGIYLAAALTTAKDACTTA